MHRTKTTSHLRRTRLWLCSCFDFAHVCHVDSSYVFISRIDVLWGLCLVCKISQNRTRRASLFLPCSALVLSLRFASPSPQHISRVSMCAGVGGVICAVRRSDLCISRFSRRFAHKSSFVIFIYSNKTRAPGPVTSHAKDSLRLNCKCSSPRYRAIGPVFLLSATQYSPSRIMQQEELSAEY